MSFPDKKIKIIVHNVSLCSVDISCPLKGRETGDHDYVSFLITALRRNIKKIK